MTKETRRKNAWLHFVRPLGVFIGYYFRNFRTAVPRGLQTKKDLLYEPLCLQLELNIVITRVLTLLPGNLFSQHPHAEEISAANYPHWISGEPKRAIAK